MGQYFLFCNAKKKKIKYIPCLNITKISGILIPLDTFCKSFSSIDYLKLENIQWDDIPLGER